MKIKILSGKKYLHADFSEPADISMPLRESAGQVNAWNAPPLKIEPVRHGSWVGEVSRGASINFRNISFNPHGNGTHTECVGHITKKKYSINRCLSRFLFYAELITVKPLPDGGDKIITRAILQKKITGKKPEALVIRTLPNGNAKKTRQYSGTNPPYFHHEAATFMRRNGIQHLLTDLPSVDKEDDGGKLLAHRAFWDYPGKTRTHCTITELVYVPDHLPDGSYLLDLQVANFENDASPSRPVLYRLY